MPIALDPNRTFDVVLKTDQGKPKKSRPTFVFRYLTVGEWQRVLSLAGDAETSKDLAASMELVVDALKVALVNWKHMGDHEFDVEDLPNILTLGEARELLDNLIQEAIPKDDDLGK